MYIVIFLKGSEKCGWDMSGQSWMAIKYGDFFSQDLTVSLGLFPDFCFLKNVNKW